ncbi:hypothetical protein PY546_13000 [Providencia stuartii]|nr:hypothetical protein [Providencia stuartii]
MAVIKQCLNKVGCTLVSEIVGTAVGSMVTATVVQAFNSLHHPVHAATGSKVLNGENDTDFIIEGGLSVSLVTYLPKSEPTREPIGPWLGNAV